MLNLSFIKQYISHPRTVGAILPSSQHLAEKMLCRLDFECAECIAEFGPGTGVFTDLLIERKEENTKLLVFETNDIFYEKLVEKYKKEPNVFLIHDSAENIQKYLAELSLPNVDYIVSGLPFASLPKETSKKILNQTRKVLNDKGLFITFQYTLLKKGFIEKYFMISKILQENRNIPPAYVLICKKKPLKR